MSEEQNIQGSSEEEIRNIYIRNQRTVVCPKNTIVIDDLEISQWSYVEVFRNIENSKNTFLELLFLRNIKKDKILY